MQYTWLIWSLILIVIWLAVYWLLRSSKERREMFVVSLGTSLLGLTEPFFVPEYWSPPSLFDLAVRTGFDLESLIFSFGIGGLAFALYSLIFRVHHTVLPLNVKHSHRHRFHWLALLSAPVIFIGLLTTTDFNPIYSAIIAMVAGGLAAWYCRPDLKQKMITSAILFSALYFVYFLILIAISPDYVEQVWNLAALSGVLVLGIPMEELLFAGSFGFIWSSIYEHLVWKKIQLAK